MSNKTINVRTSKDTIEEFDENKIKETLLRETGATEKEALEIANDVKKILKKIDIKYLTSPIIREITNATLLENGFEEIRNKHTRLGSTPYDIETLISNGNKDNANMSQNPETIHKYVADESMKQHALLNLMPKRLADNHLIGNYHQHDLEFFAARGLNCCQHDLRLFIRFGLKVDGTGDHTSIAAPPTHMETVMNHSGEILLAAQQNMSGGQAFSLWNVFVAPFAKGLPYERIKQCVEMFIFNLNMAYAARGGQVPFTSVGLEFTVPDFLKDETAYGPGGKAVGVYGDYEEEVRMIQRAFTEVLLDGDANGKPHLFPNTIYYLREECLKPEFEDDIDMVHYLSAKFGTAYYINMLPKYQGTHANYMGAVSSDTPLIYKKNGKVTIGKAEDFEELCTDIDGNLKTYYRRMDEIEDNYEFLTYNPDGSKAWKPVKTVMKKEPSELYRIKTKNGKVLKITGNHKIPVLRENRLVEVRSEDLKVGDLLYEYVESEFINHYVETDVTLTYELLGIFLADGYIKHEGNNKHKKNSQQVEFHFNKESKIIYLSELLDKLQLKYNNTENKDGTHTITVHVGNGALRDMFVGCYDGHNKIFPSSLFNTTTIEGYSDLFKRNISCVVKGMLFDGSKTEREQVFYSSNENIALSFMYSLSLLGIRYAFSTDKRNDWNMCYRICFDWNNKGYQPTKSIIKSIELIENKEPVYDFEIKDNHNYVAGWGFLHIENCRTRLSDNWTGDWETDTLRCGNLAYVTINLPRLAYRSKSEDEFFDLLDEQLENAKEILLIRRERAMKCLNEYKILPFLTQQFDGEPYYRVENSTLSFGFCGLNEMLLSMTGGGVANPESNKLGHKVIDFINDKTVELKSETPYRWSIIQTPAESTAYRFATMDSKMYPNKVICNGEEGSYYYTNSNHLPVDTDLSLPEKIKIESEYHPKTQGGHIFHAFMGESYSDPDSLRSLTNKICRNSDIGFWAYSSALSYCNKCGTLMKGLQEQCTHCGETHEVEWYDRITGYVQQVGHSNSASSGWNAGKKQELIDRRRFEQ